LAEGLPKTLEDRAQRCAAQLIARGTQGADGDATPAPERFQDAGVTTLEQVRPRSAGVEHAALMAIRQLRLDEKLRELGFTGPRIAAALGNVIGRMAAPGAGGRLSLGDAAK